MFNFGVLLVPLLFVVGVKLVLVGESCGFELFSLMLLLFLLDDDTKKRMWGVVGGAVLAAVLAADAVVQAHNYHW